MDKKLFLEFEDEKGDIAKIMVNDPKADLDEATVLFQMNAMVQANVFDNKGSELTTASAAYVIEQTKTVYL